MPLQCTYLLINFLAVIICFIFSFDRRIRFNEHFGAWLKAAMLVSVPFICWDVWFTEMGVWWFRDRYLTGIRIAGLPLEEWLFFFVFRLPAYSLIIAWINFSIFPGRLPSTTWLYLFSQQYVLWRRYWSTAGYTRL
ncbi:lycopene cyclase domain-containing protein [Chitinophaga pollutisoli]|uniref:lycopene cyclase domain-containing protein n=1 Tax=Chitinophaga pollutisoli TaxID=3133966 RepID=UPI0038578486